MLILPKFNVPEDEQAFAQISSLMPEYDGRIEMVDATAMHHHADSKALRKERQKKIVLGHKEDDHEEEPTWQQTM